MRVQVTQAEQLWSRFSPPTFGSLNLPQVLRVRQKAPLSTEPSPTILWHLYWIASVIGKNIFIYTKENLQCLMKT